METMGDRIRRVRLARGLTQQQLAGSELTRSFICRVERGKVRPSRQVLELFAARLGKPVTYFTDETMNEDRLQAEARKLRERAQLAVAAGQFDPALGLARQGLEAAVSLGRTEDEFRARLALVQVHEHRGEYREALAAGAALGDQAPTPLLAEAYLHLGHCSLGMEQLPAARRYYQQVLRLAGGSQRLAELYTEAQMSLGCCCLTLGETDEAAGAFRQVLDFGDSVAAAGLGRLGMGSVLFLRGDVAAGLETTREARRRLEALGHPAAVNARHNQAVMEGQAGRWDRTIDLLQGCLAVYEQRGDRRLQASALEEIAHCFVAHDYWHEALEVCGQALALLDATDDSFLRGRLYRLVASVHRAGGDAQRAHDLGLVSLELFRHLGARLEVAATRAFLGSLTGQ
ncbi:MAG TPA: helix-turn-helix domain-containing protein [Symbiobacteriaceae bacterium]|nr:helix-turn-helix domain-containing protein [Symbiobacteriaceae bacterium]